VASPVKEAKAKHAADGFTEVTERGKGSLKSRKLAVEQYAATHQVGNVGWHFGDGPFTEAHEVDTAWVDAHPIDDAPWQKKMVLADYNAYAFREATHQFDQGQLIEYRHPASGEAVSFQPTQLQWTNDIDQISPIEDPEPVSATIDDDMLTWADAYGPGIDFQWETQTTRLMKYVNIASLADLGAPPQFIIDGGNPVLRVELLFQKSDNTEIWVDGVLWDEKSNNPQVTTDNVEFRLNGDPVWRFRKPKAWDNSLGDDREISPTMGLRASAQNLFVEILTPWSWLETATYPVTVDVTVEYGVSQSSDDAVQIAGNVVLGGVALVSNAANEWIAFRWQGVTIADGVTIDVANVTVTVKAAPLRDDVDHTLDFEDGAAPGTFVAAANNISNRTGTAASLYWQGVGLLAGAETTPSLVAIIQELEDSYDYSAGSSMVMRLVYVNAPGNLGLDSWDAGAASTALLHIEYTPGGGGVAPTSHLLGPLYGPLGGPIAV